MNECKYDEKLSEIICSNDWLMTVLRNVQKCKLPDWFVSAGTIRSIVWDNLHGYKKFTPIKDIDVIFYDSNDLSTERERSAEERLNKLMPSEKWDVKNQAAVHLWFKDVFGYETIPLKSSEDGIKRWNSTSIGVRLQSSGEIYIAAPYGLTDLFEMKLRRNSKHIPKEFFRRKVKERRIEERWPMVEIVED